MTMFELTVTATVVRMVVDECARAIRRHVRYRRNIASASLRVGRVRVVWRMPTLPWCVTCESFGHSFMDCPDADPMNVPGYREHAR